MSETTDNPFSPVTETLLHEAWSWLEDCGIVDEDDAENIHSGKWSAAMVIANVERAYEGGWTAFVKATEPLEQWILIHERRDSYDRLIGVTEKSNFGNTRYRAVG